jgi:hypothetical protein
LKVWLDTSLVKTEHHGGNTTANLAEWFIQAGGPLTRTIQGTRLQHEKVGPIKPLANLFGEDECGRKKEK